MGKQQRQNAPEASMVDGASHKPAEQSGAPDATLEGQNAPEASMVDGASDAAGDAGDTPPQPEPEDCPACVALNGERPCSLECYVAAGYDASTYERRFGVTLPADGEARTVVLDAVEDASAKFFAPEGKVHCRAITTCLVRGMPEFAGTEFWLEPHEAERLAGKGALEVVYSTDER